MKPPKKPPPDNEGNVLGRIRALKISVHRQAAMDTKEGGDYDKALAKHMRAAETQLKKLRARLKKVRRDQPVTPPTVKQKLAQRRAARSGTASKGDILATLNSL